MIMRRRMKRRKSLGGNVATVAQHITAAQLANKPRNIRSREL